MDKLTDIEALTEDVEKIIEKRNVVNINDRKNWYTEIVGTYINGPPHL